MRLDGRLPQWVLGLAPNRGHTIPLDSIHRALRNMGGLLEHRVLVGEAHYIVRRVGCDQHNQAVPGSVVLEIHWPELEAPLFAAKTGMYITETKKGAEIFKRPKPLSQKNASHMMKLCVNFLGMFYFIF